MTATGTSSVPHLTLVIVSWNSADVVADCLSAIETYASGSAVEVIVADNASRDGSVDLVERRFPWVRVIRNTENLGYGGAANRALATSSAPLLAVANADTAVTQGAIEALVGAATRLPDVGVFAPRIVDATGVAVPSFSSFPRLRGALIAAFGLHRLSPALKAFAELGHCRARDGAVEVEWVLGAFMVFRAEAYRSFNGFDDTRWMYGEDLDVCWRARTSGWKVAYVPSAVVRHVGQASTRQIWSPEEIEAHSARARYAWVAARRGRPRAVLMALIVLGGAAARIAVSSIRGKPDPTLKAWWSANAIGLRAALHPRWPEASR